MQNQENNEVQNSGEKNTLSTASLVLAIIAIASCWVPWLNLISMVLAIISILLGAWSLINIIRKKSQNIKLPVISIVLSVLSIVGAVIMNNFTSNIISKTLENAVSSAIKDSAK